ncbi:hypothetical protein [Methanolobus profundi]|uniref:Uncharacterized protein n=1 Tax=Methanolobus profundi TaxID=487685 RepID=A0A1I4ULS1_9EURY|nr:hypothetical protein [Methanolobus profundi]SFM89888.1 hypothetical protein SAMN04488696_2779 [Methanolobus profundi]
MKKPFLKTELKRVIIEPEEGLDEISLVPGMNPEYIKNAVVTVSEDGYAFVSWLQPIKDWKYHLAGFAWGCLFWFIVILISIVFWIVCGDIATIYLQEWGVI